MSECLYRLLSQKFLRYFVRTTNKRRNFHKNSSNEFTHKINKKTKGADTFSTRCEIRFASLANFRFQRTDRLIDGHGRRTERERERRKFR